jgi:hypothetical protein
MKELFSKSFWRDIKSTFYLALQDSPPKNQAPQAPAQISAQSNPKDSLKPESPAGNRG